MVLTDSRLNDIQTLFNGQSAASIWSCSPLMWSKSPEALCKAWWYLGGGVRALMQSRHWETTTFRHKKTIRKSRRTLTQATAHSNPMFWIAESLCRKPCQGSQPYSWTVSPCRIWSTCSPTSSPGSEKKRQSSRWAFGSTHLNLLRRSSKMLPEMTPVWLSIIWKRRDACWAKKKVQNKSGSHISWAYQGAREVTRTRLNNSDWLPFLSAEARSLSLSTSSLLWGPHRQIGIVELDQIVSRASQHDFVPAMRFGKAVSCEVQILFCFWIWRKENATYIEYRRTGADTSMTSKNIIHWMVCTWGPCIKFTIL